MRRVTRVMSVPVVAMLLVSGCGGDDDAPAGEPLDAGAAESAEPAESDESGGDDVRKTDEGVPVATDVNPDEDLVAGIMASFLGPEAVDLLTQDERDCMNEVLSPSFPTGLPPGLAATPEFQGVLDALDTAAEACDVTL